jgi:hypothetical protein
VVLDHPTQRTGCQPVRLLGLLLTAGRFRGVVGRGTGTLTGFGLLGTGGRDVDGFGLLGRGVRSSAGVPSDAVLSTLSVASGAVVGSVSAIAQTSAARRPPSAIPGVRVTLPSLAHLTRIFCAVDFPIVAAVDRSAAVLFGLACNAAHSLSSVSVRTVAVVG